MHPLSSLAWLSVIPLLSGVCAAHASCCVWMSFPPARSEIRHHRDQGQPRSTPLSGERSRSESRPAAAAVHGRLELNILVCGLDEHAQELAQTPCRRLEHARSQPPAAAAEAERAVSLLRTSFALANRSPLVDGGVGSAPTSWLRAARMLEGRGEKFGEVRKIGCSRLERRRCSADLKNSDNSRTTSDSGPRRALAVPCETADSQADPDAAASKPQFHRVFSAISAPFGLATSDSCSPIDLGH